MSSNLQLRCNVCGKIFSSMMLFDMHLKLYDKKNFFEMFEKVSENEIKQGRSQIQFVLDNYIKPKILEIKQKKNLKKGKQNSAEFLQNHSNKQNNN